jgi:hypothetical protein
MKYNSTNAVRKRKNKYLISIITKTVAIYLYRYDINVKDVKFKKSPGIINIFFFVVTYNRISPQLCNIALTNLVA